MEYQEISAVVAHAGVQKRRAVGVERARMIGILRARAQVLREEFEAPGMGGALGYSMARNTAVELEHQATELEALGAPTEEQGGEEDLKDIVELEQVLEMERKDAVHAEREMARAYLKSQAAHFQDVAGQYKDDSLDRARCLGLSRELETQARRIKHGYHTPEGSEGPGEEELPTPTSEATAPTFATLRETPEVLHSTRSLDQILNERRVAMERAISDTYPNVYYQGNLHRTPHTAAHAYWYRGYVVALIHVLEIRKKRKAQQTKRNDELSPGATKRLQRIQQAVEGLGATVTRALGSSPSFPVDMLTLAARVKDLPTTRFDGPECWLRVNSGVLRKLETLAADVGKHLTLTADARDVADVLLREALTHYKPEKAPSEPEKD